MPFHKGDNMADDKLSIDVSINKGTGITRENFDHWTQNGTGQGSKKSAPIAIVSVPRKSPDSVESLMYQAIKRNWTDKERADAYAIVDSDLATLHEQVFGDKLAEFGKANNIGFVIDIYKMIHRTK